MKRTLMVTIDAVDPTYAHYSDPCSVTDALLKQLIQNVKAGG